MDRNGFRNMLQERKVPEEKIGPAIALAERFEGYLHGKPANAESAWEFSKVLIDEGKNTYENYVTLIRYCRFIKKDEMFIALMELVDGGEVADNLHRMVAERFGEAVREEVYSGKQVTPYGLPTPEKPATFHPVLERLQVKVGEEPVREFLSGCLRDLPDAYYQEDKQRYQEASDIDEFLKRQHQGFVDRLKECQRQGELFFVQEITDEVLDYIKDNQEVGGGVREGNIVYQTKIPYMTKQFLAESDPVMKRYYACHCPWVREAIRQGSTGLVQDFCYCSGGFHKKSFEVIFGKTLKVEVLDSVLKGDLQCRFAIHLPEEAIP